MHASARRGPSPALKQIVLEASQALAQLDADRLEELARSCAALNRDWRIADAVEHAELTRQASESADDMAIFARVLEVTRANLAVMSRLRDLRQGRIEYRAPGVLRGTDHGNH